MNWLDLVLALVIAGAAALEMFRGFGRAVWDALGLYGALWLAGGAALPLAQRVHFHSGAALNHAYAFGLLCLVVGGLALGLSRFVYGMTLLHTGMFEGLLGLAAGVAVGVIAAHALTQSLVMADPDRTRSAALVAAGSLGPEVYGFRSYHNVLDTLAGIASTQRQIPDVSR